MSEEEDESTALVRMPAELHNRLRRLLYWERITQRAFLTDAVKTQVEAAEKAHGGPYPELPDGQTQLSPGRPLKPSK